MRVFRASALAGLKSVGVGRRLLVAGPVVPRSGCFVLGRVSSAGRVADGCAVLLSEISVGAGSRRWPQFLRRGGPVSFWWGAAF